MTVSRPSLRIRRGRWRTRALAASPTAAERTARCSTGGEEGAEELVRDGPQLLFALLRFFCRPGRWSTRLKLQRPPEGSAQVDGNVAKIDLAARGVDGALVHFNAPSWAVRAVMSSTTLPVCPKTGSTSPSLTVHLCLHTAPGNRECARRLADRSSSPGRSSRSSRSSSGTGSGPCSSARCTVRWPPCHPRRPPSAGNLHATPRGTPGRSVRRQCNAHSRAAG